MHILAAAGYDTGHKRKMWGPGNASNWEVNPAGPKFEYFGDFLKRRDPKKPFCFCFGAYDPHRGYVAGSGKGSGMNLDKIEMFDCFPDSKQIRSDIADYYFEVQRFDREVGEALKMLEDLGELENTIVVVTGDHGMPFPRCKSNLYDSGTRVPMAVRWPNRIRPGRVAKDFVSTTDLAPTFLEVAGIAIPDAMTGKSWLPIFKRDDDSSIDAQRDHVIFGKERHVPSQEAPDNGGYPMRAIRTAEYLLIKNFRPDRWPNGTPNYLKANIPYAWLADTDNGPTKTYIVKNREKDAHHQRCYDLCFAKRPRFELYDIAKDPEQLNNLADSPDHIAIKDELHSRLMKELLETDDPRAKDSDAATTYFDAFKYLGSGPRHPTWKKKQKPGK
jgi:arylsulfatase A-like enzyme